MNKANYDDTKDIKGKWALYYLYVKLHVKAAFTQTLLTNSSFKTAYAKFLKFEILNDAATSQAATLTLDAFECSSVRI